MIYADSKISLTDDDFLISSKTQKFNLGEKVTVNRGFDESLYSATYVYAKTSDNLVSPYLKYKPYMLVSNFELQQYSIDYEPNNAEVVCTQFDMAAGEYGFVLYQGEGLFLIKGTAPAIIGEYIKAEGDEVNWGYEAARSSASAGFISESSARVDPLDPVKAVLFGHEINVSPTI